MWIPSGSSSSQCWASNVGGASFGICTQCVLRNGKGWCDGKCHFGNSAGPTNGHVCADNNWKWRCADCAAEYCRGIIGNFDVGFSNFFSLTSPSGTLHVKLTFANPINV